MAEQISLLDPISLTCGDLCKQALRECNAVGVGQTPLAEDINDAWFRLQTMLQQWERKRWRCYHISEYTTGPSTGQTTPYTIGPGQQIDTNTQNPWNAQFNNQFGGGQVTSARPNRIEYAFLRQITNTQAGPGTNLVDYPLRVLQSREDYSKIALKTMVSFPGCVFLDTDWPVGKLYCYPVMQANIYALYVGIRCQLPIAFATLATKFILPFEYYAAMLYNLAVRLCPKYGIAVTPEMAVLAKDSLNCLDTGNAQIAALGVPSMLTRPGIYNVFDDRNY